MIGRATIRSGAIGGITGGISIWIYEAIVWVGLQHLLPLEGIPRNATGLVFGKHIQQALGLVAYGLGTAIHFGFAIIWGIVFALIWPALRRRGIEATFAALVYAALLWIVMHAAISIATKDHPDYTDPAVVIGGFVSHLFYTIPLALMVRHGRQ